MQNKYLQGKQTQRQASTGFKAIKITIPVQEVYPVALSSPQELDQLQGLFFYILLKLTRKQVPAYRL